MKCILEFSPNRPTGLIWSRSRDVRPYVCCILSPSDAIFFEASHWPSDHMISLRPLIGQPSFTTKLSIRVKGVRGVCGIFF